MAERIMPTDELRALLIEKYKKLSPNKFIRVSKKAFLAYLLVAEYAELQRLYEDTRCK